MKKTNQFIVGSGLRLGVDKLVALVLVMPDALVDVGNFERQMVDAFSPFFDEAGNSRIVVRCFQKFDLHIAYAKKRRSDLLRKHLFNLIVISSQEPREELVRLLYVPDRDADMFQLFHNWVNFAIQRRNFLAYSKVLEELSVP